MYGDKTTAKERMKKGGALHKALMNKADKKHIKQGISEAHKRIKKSGMDFNKI